MSKPLFKHWLALAALTGITLAVDQLTKTIIVMRLYPGEMVIPVPAIGDFFRVIRSQNTGAAFGMFSGAGDLFSIIAVVVIVILLVMHGRSPAGAWAQRVGFGLLMGGALGNVFDRVQYGHVVDFINYRIPGVFSNVSNLADHAIVAGVLILVWLSWRPSPAPANPGPESTPTPEA